MSDLVVSQVDQTVIVDFGVREILDLAKSNAIGVQLCDLTGRDDVANILVDFRQVKLITSSMIGELIKFRQKCEVAKVKLKFCNLSNDLLGILKKLKLDKLFQIYASRELAAKAIQANK